jgi:hypothetical protein
MLVSLLADVGRVKTTRSSLANETSNGVSSGVLNIRLAASEQIGSRLAEPVLRSLREEPSDDKGESEPEQTGV